MSEEWINRKLIEINGTSHDGIECTRWCIIIFRSLQLLIEDLMLLKSGGIHLFIISFVIALIYVH